MPAPRSKPARKPAKARRKPAARYHHGDLAEALRSAALEAIARDGVEKLNLRDLARQLGVSPGAPYRHYADKDALLKAVGAEIAANFQAEVARAQAEAPPDAISQFRAIGIANVRFAVRYPAHFRVLYLPGIIDQQAAAQMAEERAILRAAQDRGELVELPVDDIALAASSLVYGLSRLIVDDLLPGPPVTPARADELAIAVTNVFGLGLLPRARPC